VVTEWDSDGGLPGGLLCCSTLDAEALLDGGWGADDLSDLSDMMNEKWRKWKRKRRLFTDEWGGDQFSVLLATPNGSQRNENLFTQMKKWTIRVLATPIQSQLCVGDTRLTGEKNKIIYNKEKWMTELFTTNENEWQQRNSVQGLAWDFCFEKLRISRLS